MYNVRYFVYENSIQFRLYSEHVRCVGSSNEVALERSGQKIGRFGSDVVDFSDGLVLWNVVNDFDDDDDDFMYLPDDFDFNLLEDAMKEEIKRKREDSIRSSVNRTKRNIVYLARSNSWDWFVTFTLNPEKVNRYNYCDSSKKVRKFLNNLRRLVPDMVYILVPELHKDGAWHFHGLMKNIESLDMFDSGLKDDAGREIYNMVAYKLGWSTCTRVGESDKAANYLMKYITKDVCEATKGRRRYWPSKNINRALVYQADLHGDEFKALKERLYECMTWKKKVCTEFQHVEIFEVPKDFFDKED